MHNFIVILFFFVYSGPLFAQTCKHQISGEIHDGESNETLSGAVVSLKELNLALETDSTGTYGFYNICTDSVLIEVSCSGYKAYSSKLKLKPGFHLDILLHSESCELSSVVIVHRKEALKTLNSTSIASDDLEAQRGKSLGEILKTLPGVDAIQTGPNVYKPIVQGFSGNRIVIIQQQVRLEGQNWGNDHAPEVDPFSSEKITVVKGSHALIYGPEAQAGAIVVAPYTPLKQHGVYGKIFSNFQTNNRMFQEAAVLDASSHKLHGWHLHLQGSHKYGGNIKAPSHFLDNTGARELNGNIGFGYESARHVLRFTYSIFTQKLGIYRGAHIGNLSDLIKNLRGQGYENKDGFTYQLQRSYQQTRHRLCQVSYQYHLKNGAELSILLSTQSNLREEYDVHRPKNDLGKKANMAYDLNTYQGELIYNHRLIKKHMMKSGIQASWQDNITKTTDLRMFLPNFSSRSLAAYHISSLIFEKTQLDLGLRYDLRHQKIYKYVDKLLSSPEHTYHALSASFGIDHTFSKRLSLTYNSAFTMRPPGINELFSDGVHHGESIFIANTKKDFDFKTENSLNSTVALRHTTKQFSTTLSLYYNRIQNFIFLKPTTPISSIRGTFPAFYYTQAAAAVTGMDLDHKWQLAKRWRLHTKGGITCGKEQYSNSYLPNMPTPQASSGLQYALGNTKIIKNTELGMTYAYFFKQVFFPKDYTALTYNTVNGQEIFVIDGDYLPAPKAYALINARASTHITLGKTDLALYISVNNLMNVRYRNYLNRMRYYTDEQGFNCSATAKLSF